MAYNQTASHNSLLLISFALSKFNASHKVIQHLPTVRSVEREKKRIVDGELL